MEKSNAFGMWLRKQRREVLGLTQGELAHRVFCSEAMIRKIESGDRRPARDLAERLMTELGVTSDDLAAYVAWARGLASENDVLARHRETSWSGDVELRASGSGSQWVLVPLDSVASFGSESPTIVQLSEPFMGRVQWVPVPLAAVTDFGLKPPCWEHACNGQDAESSGCAKSSVTVDGHEIFDPVSGAVLGSVELRYSQACQTNWARMTRLCREQRRLTTYLRDETGDIIVETMVEIEPPRVYGYGPMWWAPTGKIRVQACGVIDGYDEVCTSLY